MKASQKTRTRKRIQARKRSCAEKMAVAAGSLAGLGILPGAAQAAPITVTGSPVTLTIANALGSVAEWDIDGDTLAEFGLLRAYYSASSAGIFLAKPFSSNPGGLEPGVLNDAAAESFNVGPTLAPAAWTTLNSTASSYGRRALAINYITTNSYGPPYIAMDGGTGFVDGDNFLGFRFRSGADTHYGFARLNFDTVGGVVSILDWVYESTPDTAVHIQPFPDTEPPPIPEPSSLALLALGAGGLAVLRRRQARESAAPSKA